MPNEIVIDATNAVVKTVKSVFAASPFRSQLQQLNTAQCGRAVEASSQRLCYVI